MAKKNRKYREVVSMYEQGMSVQDIADFFEITRQAMWKILKRRGCNFRDNKRHGEENHFYRGTKAEKRVHRFVERAIKRGIIVKKTHCEVCGSTGEFKDGRSKIQAHHTDYSKPLQVMWLCQQCHHKWHKTNKAKL